MVFEAVRTGAGDPGLNSNEHPGFERLVCIADVFRHEGKENATRRSIPATTPEKIEEEIKCRLPSGSHRDVFRPHRPPELLTQQTCEGLQNACIATRRIVNRQRAPQHSRVGSDLLHAGFPHGLHFRDVRGISSPEHERGRADARERLAQVVHEAFDSAAAGEIPTKC